VKRHLAVVVSARPARYLWLRKQFWVRCMEAGCNDEHLGPFSKRDDAFDACRDFDLRQCPTLVISEQPLT
jgi:hypothetical protein